MRGFVKLSATLLLGAFAATAHAHIDFVHARLLSLEQREDRWVLNLEIHRWESGHELKVVPQPATVQIQRVPGCIVGKALYLGTQEEFLEALDVIRAQIAAGGVQRFGMNARQLDWKMDRFLAVNLRVTQMDPRTNQRVVWTVQPETGLELCPFKYDFDR